MSENPYFAKLRSSDPELVKLVQAQSVEDKTRIAALTADVARLTQSELNARLNESKAMGMVAERDARIIGLERLNSEYMRRIDELASKLAAEEQDCEAAEEHASKADADCAMWKGKYEVAYEMYMREEAHEDKEDDEPDESAPRKSITYIVQRDSVGDIVSITSKPED